MGAAVPGKSTLTAGHPRWSVPLRRSGHQSPVTLEVEGTVGFVTASVKCENLIVLCPEANLRRHLVVDLAKFDKQNAKLYMPQDSATVKGLKQKRRELEKKRGRLRERITELDERIDALDKTLGLFDHSASEGDSSVDRLLNGWPVDASMPKKVMFVFEQVNEVMQPREVDKYVRANERPESDVRDNAVAETMSRLYRQDRLQRKDYEESSSHYGLPSWWDENGKDFYEDVKPNWASQ